MSGCALQLILYLILPSIYLPTDTTSYGTHGPVDEWVRVNKCVLVIAMLKRKFPFKGGKGRGHPKRARTGVAGNKSWFSSGGSSKRLAQGRPTQVKVPGNIGLAERAFVKLKTTFQGSFTSTSGAFSTARVLNLNSVLDPLGSLSALASMGSVQWFAMYHRYRVHAFKVVLHFTPPVAGSPPYMVAMHPSSTTQTAPTTMEIANGQPLSVYGVANGGTSSYPLLLSMYTTIARVFGQSKLSIAADDTYSALVTANPGQLAVLNLSFQSLDVATTATSALFGIELTQWVEFYQPKLLTTA